MYSVVIYIYRNVSKLNNRSERSWDHGLCQATGSPTLYGRGVEALEQNKPVKAAAIRSLMAGRKLNEIMTLQKCYGAEKSDKI